MILGRYGSVILRPSHSLLLGMPVLKQLLRLILLPFVIVARLIFWLLLAIAALLLLKRLGRDRTPPAGYSPKAPSATGTPSVENIVACTRCGLLLPESEAIVSSGHHYCCEEHRKGR